MLTYARAMSDLLIVDDDPDVADTLREVLTLESYTVRIAHDGEEGLRMVRDRHPNAILLDVEMPVLDGPGMVYDMLIHNAGEERIPVILLSGTADLHRIALRIGTPYYLPKPFRLDEFLELLRRALQEKAPPRQMAY